MIKTNEDFFPTPEKLAIQMISKINNKREIKTVLEPSAGNGQLIEHFKNYVDTRRFRVVDIKAIEIENDLQAILRSKNINVIDSDFLKYEGSDQFDLIIANFPFSNGHLHLLKAIDILYSGQIVCLLNAETIKNPYCNERKLLIRRLDELNAKIEYIQDAFINAERKTNVEVALIHIEIEKDIEIDLFKNVKDTSNDDLEININFDNKNLAMKDTIVSIVREYKYKVKLGVDTILNYYKNYRDLGKYIALSTNDDTRYFNDNIKDLTAKVKEETNNFLKNIRKHFWLKTLQLPEVQARLTEKRKKEFLKSLQEHENMEFTESNVRQFMINLINSYNEILKDAIEEIFEMMSVKYAWDESIHQKNVHYFNGWKSNNAFKINKKVILPNLSLDSDFSGNRYLRYNAKDNANDIDKVMNYFDKNYRKDYIKISDVATSQTTLEDGTVVKKDIFSKLESEYFEIKFYKKGTCHLVFKDEEILRAFNIEAGKRKGWLPPSYGTKKKSELTLEELEIVKEFEEDISKYDNFVGNAIGLNINKLLSAA